MNLCSVDGGRRCELVGQPAFHACWGYLVAQSGERRGGGGGGTGVMGGSGGGGGVGVRRGGQLVCETDTL